LRESAQVQIVGVEAAGRLPLCPLDLGKAQPRFDRAGDTRCYLVLKLENAVEGAVNAVCPDVSAGRRVDKLGSDAYPVAALADAAFEHVAHAQFAADLLQVDRFALVGEARIAGDHEQPRKARNCGGDILDDAVGEILLLRVAAEILKRQDRQRRFLWQRQRRRRHGRDLAEPHAKDPHRPCDVLDLLLTQILESDVELVAYLIAHNAVDANSARLGQRFKTRGDVDAIAENVVVLDDDVAEIDADTEYDPLILRRCSVPLGHPALHRDRAGDGLNDARELDQDAVTGGLDDAAFVLRDARIDQVAAVASKTGKSPNLVLAHEAAVADDISGEYGREPALDPLSVQNSLSMVLRASLGRGTIA